MKLLFLFIATFQLSFALIITPEDALKQSLHAKNVTKKAMILTKDEHQKIQQLAKSKLKSKLFRLYTASSDDKVLGHGILLTQKVRSKTTAILYMIDTKGELLAIEVIAFNEPKEYMPSKRWLKQFNEEPQKISSITGATLSANAVKRAAKLAQAIWEVKFQ